MVKPKYTFKQYTMTRLLGSVSFNPVNSEEIFYTDNTRGRFDLWKQTLPGSYPKQLTMSEEWTPRGFGLTNDGKTIVLVADYQGNELMQIFLLPVNGGIPKRITKNDKKRYMPAINGFIDDSHLIVTTDSLGSTMDIGILDIRTGEIEQLTASDTNYFGSEVSPDMRYLLIGESLSNTNQNFYLLDLESRDLELLTPHEGEVTHSFQAWNADSSGFWYTTNEGREFNAGAYYDLQTKEKHLKITPDWDVNQIATSRDGKWLAYMVNEHGFGRLYLKNLETDTMVDPAKFPQGIAIIQEFSRDSKYLAYNFTDSTKVSDAHILNLETMEEYVVTDNMLGGIDPSDMVLPELVTITGGELEIPAFLYKPKDIASDAKIPMILSIHGGPESQERPTYNYLGLYQVFLSLGIGILAPNIRGSTGYGITYQRLIHRKWGDIKDDIKSCAEYMKSLDWVDENRLGVFGGSFGGFATLFSVTQLPEYWKIGMDLVGPSNLVTFVKSVPEFWKPMMKAWVGDPVEDEDMLNSISPINYVDQIQADMFIGQGANDPRVVKTESDQIVEKLQSMGRYVKYKVWEDEGHGFTKQENMQEFLRLTIEFAYERFFGEEIDLTAADF